MPSRRRLFLVLYAASGAAALVYEITWTRLLTLLMGHTVAAASTVLAAIMGGLALGSWVGGRLAAARCGRSTGALDSSSRYAVLEIGVAIAALALPFLLTASRPSCWPGPTTMARRRSVRAGARRAVVAPGWRAGHRDGRDVSDRRCLVLPAPPPRPDCLYAANTAGPRLGALAAGFWLIPAIGLRATTWVGVALNVAAACGALWLATRRRDRMNADDWNAWPGSAGLGRTGPRHAGCRQP